MCPLPSALLWFRRDLRDFDNTALAEALTQAAQVYCVFVFDREILDPLVDRADRRIQFIRDSLVELDAALRIRGGSLIVLYDHARRALPALAANLGVVAVFCNRDYEPTAIARDDEVAAALKAKDIAFVAYKDQVIFDWDEIRTQSQKPYTVYTPYKKAWLRALSPCSLAPQEAPATAGALAPPPPAYRRPIPTLSDIGFSPVAESWPRLPPGMKGGSERFRAFQERIDAYEEGRDYPALDAPSHLSVDLRFGTVSIRQLVAYAHAASLHSEGSGAQTWLQELIWREFYAQLLWHFPAVTRHAFQSRYDTLPFRNDEHQFTAWCEGRTGYPLVDAAMRQLNSTGYMHNRLRMITASFLVKHLLIDWRWGERYFARKLIDYDLASNNGGWQWAASTGTDAQPWFRIFSPVAQSMRFDREGEFIRRFVPELSMLSAAAIHAPWKLSPDAQTVCGFQLGRDYPPPIVDHAAARAAALDLFRSV